LSSTRKSLAGSAAAVAQKVMGRRPRATVTSSSPTATAKQTSAKKPAVKKAPAKKTSAKVTATKAPAKKAPAKKAPATKAPAKKTTVKAPATKAPAKKTTATKAPAKKTTATKAPAKKAPAKAPARKAPARKVTGRKVTGRTATPVRAATASALAVRAGEDAWTKAELAEVVEELHRNRSRLTNLLHDQEEELAGLMRDAGDGAGHDQADMGATSFERDQELIVVNSERDMLAQIDRALGRIDDGTYGICESCGQPIGKMRVMAFPRATLCMSCKQREERR
jgi:DnaK suppressor protein